MFITAIDILTDKLLYLIQNNEGKLFDINGLSFKSVSNNKIIDINGRVYFLNKEIFSLVIKLYEDYIARINNDGGFFIIPNPKDFQNDVDTILPLNPIIYTPANAGKVSKMYSLIPDTGAGDFTVSRNGTATYFDKDGLLKTAAADEPRFEFDPLTGDFKGVLVEPAATNLCTNSDPSTLPTDRWNVSFATNDWAIGLNNKIIFDNVGGTVDIFIGNSQGGTQPMGRANNANNHRISFFAKRVDGQKPIVYPSTEGSISGNAILADPTVDVFFYNGVFANSSRHFDRIEIPLTNNVWYFEYTFSSTFQPLDRTIIFRKGENNSTNIVEISGINVIVLSESPSSYIPTTGSQVTRPADVIDVTVPVGVTEIKETVNGVENTITSIPTTYQLPNGQVSKVIMT